MDRSLAFPNSLKFEFQGFLKIGGLIESGEVLFPLKA